MTAAPFWLCVLREANVTEPRVSLWTVAAVMIVGGVGFWPLAAPAHAGQDDQGGKSVRTAQRIELPKERQDEPPTSPSDTQGVLPKPLQSTGSVARPPLGERPSPSEAHRAGEATNTRMRPPEGSASGGKSDVPVKR
jgi:hypothetical protein